MSSPMRDPAEWDPSQEWGTQFKARATNMLDLYARTLSDLGYEPRAFPDTALRHVPTNRLSGKYDMLCHALWMCGEAMRFVTEGRQAKAYRWIGMIQGLLWAHGVFSIEELKSHNELGEEFWARWDRREIKP